MKKLIFVLLLFVLLVGCGENDSAEDDVDISATASEEKHTEMLDTGVKMYLNQMTAKYSSAFTVSLTSEDKIKYLNEAITDINIAVYEIEDEYEEGTPPTEELFKLADALLASIDYEMIGESEKASNSAQDAGEIIGDLSREYLDGELPVGIKIMTGTDNAND